MSIFILFFILTFVIGVIAAMADIGDDALDQYYKDLGND